MIDWHVGKQQERWLASSHHPSHIAPPPPSTPQKTDRHADGGRHAVLLHGGQAQPVPHLQGQGAPGCRAAHVLRAHCWQRSAAQCDSMFRIGAYLLSSAVAAPR